MGQVTPTEKEIEIANDIESRHVSNWGCNPDGLGKDIAKTLAQSRRDEGVRVGMALLNAIPPLQCISLTGVIETPNDTTRNVLIQTITSLGIDLEEPKEYKKPKFID